MNFKSSDNLNYITSIDKRSSAYNLLSPPPPSSPIPIPSSSSPAGLSSPASDFVLYKDSYSYPLSSPSFSPYAFDSPHTPPTDPELDLDFDFATVGMHHNNYSSEADYFAAQWLNDPILPSNDMDLPSSDYRSCLSSSVTPGDLIAHPQTFSMSESGLEGRYDETEADVSVELDSAFLDTPSPHQSSSWSSHSLYNPSVSSVSLSHLHNPLHLQTSNALALQHVGLDIDPSSTAIASSAMTINYASASSGPALHFPLIGNDNEDVDFTFNLDGDYDSSSFNALAGTSDNASYSSRLNSVAGGAQAHHGVVDNMTNTPGIGMSNARFIIGRGAATSVTSGIGASTSSFDLYQQQKQSQQQQYNYNRPSSSSNAEFGFIPKTASAFATHRNAGNASTGIAAPSVSSTAPRLLLRSTSHHADLSQGAAASVSPLSGYGMGLDTPLYSKATSVTGLGFGLGSNTNSGFSLGFPASAPAESSFYTNNTAGGSSFLLSDQETGGTSAYTYEHGQRHGHVKRPSVMSMFGAVRPGDMFSSGNRAFSSSASGATGDKDATLRASNIARVRTKSETGDYSLNNGEEIEDKEATIHAYSSRTSKIRGRLGNLKMKKEDDMDVDIRDDFGSTSGVEADVDMDVDMDPDATVRRRRRKRREDDFNAISPTPHASTSASPQSPQTPLKSSLKPPKLAPSTWQLYFTDWIQRHQVSSGSSGDGEMDRKLNVAQAAKEAGAEYAKLTEEQKEPFKRRSVELKEQRQRELTLWQKNLSPADIKRENVYRAAQRRAGKSRKANLKDPNAPKKPLSAYFMFLAWIRSDEARTKHVFGNEKETTGQSVLAAKKWREMSDEERRPFLARAEKEKLDYEAARRLYEDSAPGIETTISFNTDDSDANFYNASTMTASSGYWSTASPSPSPLMSTMAAPPSNSNLTTQTTLAADTELRSSHLGEDETLVNVDSVTSGTASTEQLKSNKGNRTKSLTSLKGALDATADISASPPVTRSSARRRTRASVGML